jgi:hypothetical protein
MNLFLVELNYFEKHDPAVKKALKFGWFLDVFTSPNIHISRKLNHTGFLGRI